MSKKKVLVVEDEIELLNLLSLELKGQDLEVFTARNGEEGLKIALAEMPDLILTDMLMPVMDGAAMLKKLAEDDRGKNLKAIILTNVSESHLVAKATAPGQTGMWIKSEMNLADLADKVKAVLSGKEKIPIREL